MKVETKVALCRMVGMLLLTDGFLTDAEHDYFLELMERLKLDEKGRNEVRGSISLAADIRADVVLVAGAGEGDALLEEMQRATKLDEGASAAELDFIAQVKALLDA